MTERILDWAPRFDEESRNYPIRTALRASVRRRNKLWTPGPVIDQGSEGACVGFGWTAEVLAKPTPVDLTRVKKNVPRDPTRFALASYERAKELDEWDGVNYEGTSVLAGAKAMKDFGLLKEYRWAFGINDVVDAVLAKGPVVLGLYWYDDMYEAPGGVLTPGGPIVGGHCITAIGYSYKSERLNGDDGVILQNSWGPGWGINGLAEIRVSDLAELLQDDGEACVPSRRSYGR
jgi:hypothetical protein